MHFSIVSIIHSSSMKDVLHYLATSSLSAPYVESSMECRAGYGKASSLATNTSLLFFRPTYDCAPDDKKQSDQHQSDADWCDDQSETSAQKRQQNSPSQRIDATLGKIVFGWLCLRRDRRHFFVHKSFCEFL